MFKEFHQGTIIRFFWKTLTDLYPVLETVLYRKQKPCSIQNKVEKQAKQKKNQKETNSQIQGDQMLSLFVAKATGSVGMKALSVLDLIYQVRQDTRWESTQAWRSLHTINQTFTGHTTLFCLTVPMH